MKIAFMVSGFPKLSESFVVNQITGLIDNGHEVEIFAMFDPAEATVQDDVEKYRLTDRVHYPAIIPRNKTVCRLKALSAIVPVFLIRPFATVKILYNLLVCDSGFSYKTLFLALEFLRKRFDVIHCHFGPNGVIGSSLKRLGIKAKLVTTFHGYDVTTYVRRHGSDVYEGLFSHGDLFTYNSEATLEKMIRLNGPVEKMDKMPMGIHLERMVYAERKIGPDNRINILSVGRLVEMKGREYAIRSVALLAKKYPNVRISYTIVGDGPLRQSLQELIDSLDAGHIINLAGWVQDDRLDELYESSHIFLHPSVKASDGNMEGQGVVLVEAQACGLPVVATRHNAFLETVLDGKSGFLVAEKDVDALTERLGYLIEHSDLWPEMGRCGREFAEKNYDIKTLNRKLERMYLDLLEGRVEPGAQTG
ncbi:MAG: glycosyltransferase [Planctomycetes bacterium]|nr:glycosyltransferase [Planctomycetota bacterium]